MNRPGPEEISIGAALTSARERAGIELEAAEEATKIRAKYLLALEAESWEELPSPAYARGFLRTYAAFLGLDADAMLDRFRRTVESGRPESPYPLGDQVLERRRVRRDTRSSRPWLALALLGLLIAAGLLSFILLDDDEGTGRDGQRTDPPARGERADGDPGARGRPGDPGAGPVALRLEIAEPVEVCLLGGGGEPLIDGQLLNPGTIEEFERRRFELRFPSGFDADQFELRIGGRERRLPRVEGPAAFAVAAPRSVRPADAPGRECP